MLRLLGFIQQVYSLISSNKLVVGKSWLLVFFFQSSRSGVEVQRVLLQGLVVVRVQGRLSFVQHQIDVLILSPHW